MAHGKADIEAGHPFAHELDIGQVGQDADLGRALQGEACVFGRCRVLQQPHQGRVRDHAVQRAAPVEGIEADPRPAAEVISPRSAMSGVSVASIRSIWSAMSGCRACAAATWAPRRLNSSCTEKTRCTVGPPSAAAGGQGRSAGRAARAVVDRWCRRCGCPPSRSLAGGRRRGCRCVMPAASTPLSSRGRCRCGSRGLEDAVFLLGRGGVVGLVQDDAGDVAPFAHAEEHRLRRHRAFATPPMRSTRIRPSASTLRTKKPSWSIWVKTMTEGAAGWPSKVAIRLPSRSVHPAGDVGGKAGRGSGRRPGLRGRKRPGMRMSCGEVLAQPVRSSRGPARGLHEIFARSGSTAFQVSPSIFSAEPTMQPSATPAHRRRWRASRRCWRGRGWWAARA
jgi:hypothetical protein